MAVDKVLISVFLFSFQSSEIRDDLLLYMVLLFARRVGSCLANGFIFYLAFFLRHKTFIT
jgi:hypothetical protein